MLFINTKKYQQARKRIPGRIGQIMLHYVEKNFRNESYQGKSWKPRKRGRGRGGNQSQGKPLLEQTGKLKKSFKIREANWRVIRVGSDRQVGSGINLAALHNEGVNGETATVRSYTRRSRDGSVRVRSHRRQMNIPQRQFMPILGKTGESLPKDLWQDIEKYLDAELDQLFK